MVIFLVDDLDGAQAPFCAGGHEVVATAEEPNGLFADVAIAGGPRWSGGSRPSPTLNR